MTYEGGTLVVRSLCIQDFWRRDWLHDRPLTYAKLECLGQTQQSRNMQASVASDRSFDLSIYPADDLAGADAEDLTFKHVPSSACVRISAYRCGRFKDTCIGVTELTLEDVQVRFCTLHCSQPRGRGLHRELPPDGTGLLEGDQAVNMHK